MTEKVSTRQFFGKFFLQNLLLDAKNPDNSMKVVLHVGLIIDIALIVCSFFLPGIPLFTCAIVPVFTLIYCCWRAFKTTSKESKEFKKLGGGLEQYQKIKDDREKQKQQEKFCIVVFFLCTIQIS